MPDSKKNRLIQRSKETVRDVRTKRLLEPIHAKKPGYRVTAVSLYTPEADWVDETVRILKKGGNAKANRSLVMREAILRLQESLKAKTPAEILADFNEHQALRSAMRES